MKKESKMLICGFVLLILAGFLLARCCEFSTYDRFFLLNYLNASGHYNKIAELTSDEPEPKDIFEYVSDNKIEYIYVYDDWYDVFNYVSDVDRKYFEYRVLTSDAYKLGPFKICVGAKKDNVDSLFSLTKKCQSSKKLIIFNEEGMLETIELYLYLPSIPLTYGQIGFVFENEAVKNIIYYPDA